MGGRKAPIMIDMALTSEQYNKLLLSVIHLEVRKGHLKWSVSELSRLTKITRPLIYYYLGKTKKDIFKSTLLILAKEFYGLSDERKSMKARKDKGRLQSLLASRELAMSNADVLAFFYTHRFGKNWLQPELAAMEKAYVAGLDKDLKDMSEDFSILFKALSHAFVTVPFFKNSDIEKGFNKLCELIEKEGYSTEKLRNPR